MHLYNENGFSHPLNLREPDLPVGWVAFTGRPRVGPCELERSDSGLWKDSLIVNLVKPFNVRVVLNSATCPDAGEV